MHFRPVSSQVQSSTVHETIPLQSQHIVKINSNDVTQSNPKKTFSYFWREGKFQLWGLSRAAKGWLSLAPSKQRATDSVSVVNLRQGQD